MKLFKFLMVHVIIGPKKITCLISDTTTKHVIICYQDVAICAGKACQTLRGDEPVMGRH